MAQASSIEWTDATWNPIRGCSRVSPGCGGPNHEGGCYAEKIAARFSGRGQAYDGLAEIGPHGARWTGKVQFVPELLDAPIRWRKPQRIFANSMSDLFHEQVALADIALIVGAAIAAHHIRGHVIQFLTKRSDRMRAVMNSAEFWDQANANAEMYVMEHVDPLERRSDDARATLGEYDPDNPPPGLWFGVSVEDQTRADERIPDLVATPASVRFLSCEPLLGEVQLGRLWGERRTYRGDDASGFLDHAPCIDWVICGGESGGRARPMMIQWARSLRDECVDSCVPFFFKQWGEYRPDDPAAERTSMIRVGKKAAGRLLDGREWNEMPRGA